MFHIVRSIEASISSEPQTSSFFTRKIHNIFALDKISWDFHNQIIYPDNNLLTKERRSFLLKTWHQFLNENTTDMIYNKLI